MNNNLESVEFCVKGYTDLPEEAKAFIRGYITGKLDERKSQETHEVKKSA